MPELLIRIKSEADLAAFAATLTAQQQATQATTTSGEAAAQAGATQQAAAQKTVEASNRAAAATENVGAAAQSAGASIGGARTRVDEMAASASRFVDAAGRLREADGRFTRLRDEAQQAAKGIDAAAGSMRALAHESEGSLAKLKTGFGLDFEGNAVEGLERVGDLFREAMARGIEYNAEQERHGIALAGAFKAANDELSFDQARSRGSEAMDLLRAKALELGISYHGLVESFQVNLNSMVEGGVTGLQKQVELTALLGQVAQAKGLSGFQAQRDTSDLLLGRANNTMLGRELGISNAEIEKAQAMGRTYDFLIEKLDAYKQAGALGAETFTATMQSLRDMVEGLSGELAKPAFGELSKLLKELRESGGGTNLTGTARGAGNIVGGTVEGAEGIVGWLRTHLGGLGDGGKGPLHDVFNASYRANPVANNIEAGNADAETDERKRRLQSLQEEIAAAKDAKAETAARAAVEKELTRAVAETAAATGEARDRAFQYQLLIQDLSNNIAGHLGEETDTSKTRQAGIDAKFAAEVNADPKHQLAVAKSTGDDATAATLTHKAAVDAEIDRLRKEAEQKHESPSQSELHRLAEQNVLLIEKGKALANINRENERLDRQETKGGTLSDLRQQLAEKSKEFADSVPSNLQDKFTNAQIYEGNPRTNGLLDAVRALAPATAQEAQEKEKLLRIVGELSDLEQRRADLAKKESDRQAQDAQHDADRKAAAAATSRDLQDELAITQAKARGDEQTARYLEYQLKLRHELKELADAGVDEAGINAARQRLALEYRLTEEKLKQRDADKEVHTVRPAHGPHQRHGEHETPPIQGYRAHPGDAGVDGGAGRSTAAHDLAKWKGDPDHDPAAKLASMPSAMEVADHRIADQRRNAQIASALAVSPLAPGLGIGLLSPFQAVPTAAQSVSPMLDRLPSSETPANAPSAAPGAGGADRGSGELTKAAQDTNTAAQGAADSARGLNSTLGTFFDTQKRAMAALKRELDEVKKKAETALSQMANES